MADRGGKAETKGAHLRSDIGLFDLTALIMGAMIGSGIFFLPGSMLRDAGGGAWPVMLAWVLGAVVALTGGLTFAELGAAFPKAGGQYVFLRDSLGKMTAFLFSWSGFAVVQSGTIAAVAVAMANAVDYLAGKAGWGTAADPGLPGVATPLGGLTLPGYGVGLLAVVIIWLLTYVNFLGVKRGAAVNNVATVAKTLALISIAVIAFSLGDSAGSFGDFGGSFEGATLGGFGLALAASLFAYDGFAQATFVAAEVKDARRVLPKAIVLATGLVAAIYLLATFAYFHVLPVGDVSADALAGNFPIASEAMDVVLGGVAASLVAGAIVVSTFGTVNTYVLTSPRIYYPIARDREFPRPFGVLSKHGTPTFGLWYGAIWASLLTLTGSYAALADLVVFGLYIFYLATMVGYFLLRRNQAAAFKAAGFRMPLRPLPAIFFLIASIAVLSFYIANDLQGLFDGHVGAFFGSTTGLGLILIGLGFVLYAVQGRRSDRDADAGAVDRKTA